MSTPNIAVPIEPNSPKVTVITGYYNRVDVVDMTIRSVLGQTYRDIELIAFDDRSTDGTGERLLALQQELQDPRFKVVIHIQNKGFTQGMIDAIRSSSGEYICVQGSGDISLPARVERQVALLDARPDVGAVGCWYTNIVSVSGMRRSRRPLADNLNFEELLKGNVFSHGEVMMRRNTYHQAGGYRAAFKNCQDYDLWLRIVRLSKLATVPENLYERYVRFDGVSYDPRKFATQARYSILAKRIACMPMNEAAQVIGLLSSTGPESLVPQADPDLQKRYVMAALRSIIFGGYAEAEALVSVNIVKPSVRNGLIWLIHFFQSPVLSPFRSLVFTILGVRRKTQPCSRC